MRGRRPTHAVGLDLSLRAAAACALPLGWEGDLAEVLMMTTGSTLAADAHARAQIERYVQIAHDVLVFCINHPPKVALVEDYAFSGGGQARARALAELGGAVKARLLDDLDLAVEPVTASHARKVLLQKLPRRGVKEYAVANVRRLGPIASRWTEDECDAFVIANVALERAGGHALTFEGVLPSSPEA